MNEVDKLVEGPNPDINAIGAPNRTVPWRWIAVLAVCVLLLVTALTYYLRHVGTQTMSGFSKKKEEAVATPAKAAASFETAPSYMGPTINDRSHLPDKKCENTVLIDTKTGRAVRDNSGAAIMINCEGVLAGAAISASDSQFRISSTAALTSHYDPSTEKKLPGRYSGDISLSNGAQNPAQPKGNTALMLPNGFPAAPNDSTPAILEQIKSLGTPAGVAPNLANGNNVQQGVPNAQGPIGNTLSGANTPRAIVAKTIDENLVISKGAQIDCALTTRLVTEVSGFASCLVSSNVYSVNGRTLLIERMSEVQGEYGASGQPGQRRVYVLWTRIRMPGGLTVEINSPSTDALGAAGLQGVIDNRWYERIGSAYMLSFFKDIMAYEIAKSSTTNTTGSAQVLQNTTSTSSSLAEKVLSTSINIKPTIYANQGDRVAIYVARDLDFSNVYAVHASKK